MNSWLLPHGSAAVVPPRVCSRRQRHRQLLSRIRCTDYSIRLRPGFSVRASDSQTQRAHAQEQPDEESVPENATGSLGSSDNAVKASDVGGEKQKSAFFLTESDFQDFGERNWADSDRGQADSDRPAADAERVLPTEWYLRPWVVPWGARETGIGVGAWLTSFVSVGILVQLISLNLGWTPWRAPQDVDQQALFLLLGQSARTATGLLVIWAVVRPYRPLPEGLFHISLEDPWSWRKGWLTWALLGLIAAGGAVQLTALSSTFGDEAPPVREQADALVQVLPIIAASTTSTASLLTVVGVLAPLLEETVFRGFLLPSLSKWFPLPVAIVISACAFSYAHLTPSEFTKLAALGTVLGFSYARTRNLLTPMLIHSFWNSGVIVILTLLKLEGFNIEDLI